MASRAQSEPAAGVPASSWRQFFRYFVPTLMAALGLFLWMVGGPMTLVEHGDADSWPVMGTMFVRGPMWEPGWDLALVVPGWIHVSLWCAHALHLWLNHRLGLLRRFWPHFVWQAAGGQVLLFLAFWDRAV